jgi:threonine/homoserine/homoserine lactone efflux protein
MGIETLVIVAAASLLVLMLPSPAGRMLRDYSLSRGRIRSLLLLPALWIGYLAAGLMAGAAYLILNAIMPAMSMPLSWLAVAFLVIYALRSQRQRLTFRIADNDNLPERGQMRMLLRMTLAAPRPSLVFALLAVLFQVTVATPAPLQTVSMMGLAYGTAALLAPLFQILVAENSARKIRHGRRLTTASRKPPTRFIASRAVTAGYRRIAA